MKLATKAIINAKLVFKMAWDRCKAARAIPKYSKSAKEKQKILKIYVQAQLLNLGSRRKWEVDHIIPINHLQVCGLHVASNLQVLSKTQNHNKSNTFVCYREINGQRYYYRPLNSTEKQIKIPKKYNRTKKNPLKIAKKRLTRRKIAKRS